MFSFDKAASSFSALSDPSRLKLFTIVVVESGKCDMDETTPVSMNTVTGLTKLSGLAQSTVSHHISKLKQAKLIDEKRKHNKKYLFPTKSGVEYHQYITSLFAEALATDKTIYSDILPQLQFEQKDFTELIEFISLQNFLLQGPTSLDSSFGSIRYHLYPKKNKSTVSIELTYTPVDGAIHIGLLSRYKGDLYSYVDELKTLITQFASDRASF